MTSRQTDLHPPLVLVGATDQVLNSKFKTSIKTPLFALIKMVNESFIHPFTRSFIHQWMAAAMQGTVRPHWEQLRVRCLARGHLNMQLSGSEI